MLDEQELTQVRDYVIRILPELLRQEPEIATTIEGILAQQFPRRDEFARLLDELTRLREGTEQRFERVDQRFDQVDQRFDQVDQRFDQVDHSLLEARRNIAQLQHGQEMIMKQLSGQAAWLRFVTGSLRSEKGQALEDLFAVALRYGLKNPDIAPERIRLRQKLVDTDGRVFRRGFVTEVDLIAEDGKLTVFEVKATPKASEVGLFALKAELVAAQNPDKQVQGVLISPAVTEEVRQRCAEHGLELVELQAEDFSHRDHSAPPD